MIRKSYFLIWHMFVNLGNYLERKEEFRKFILFTNNQHSYYLNSTFSFGRHVQYIAIQNGLFVTIIKIIHIPFHRMTKTPPFGLSINPEDPKSIHGNRTPAQDESVSSSASTMDL
jgi:hypothetical protein